jgi:hypothetical protein
MAIQLHAIEQGVPKVYQPKALTPSQASKNKEETSQLLDSLGLTSDPIVFDEKAFKASANFASGKDFTWDWKTSAGSDAKDARGAELSSYEPVYDYVKKVLKLNCHIVGNSQNCGKNLLHAKLFAQRKRNPFKVRKQLVQEIRTVKGRTDLVVLRERDAPKAGNILRGMIHFAMEVKTPALVTTSESGCIREAVVQLLGLNAANTQWSPCVVLTDLVSYHWVLFLTQRSLEPLKFEVYKQKCVSLRSAVCFATRRVGIEKYVKHSRCISAYFARPPSPVTSADEASDSGPHGQDTDEEDGASVVAQSSKQE